MRRPKSDKAPPDDDIRDLDAPVWAGVIPMRWTTDTPINDPVMKNDIPMPASVASVVEKYSRDHNDPALL